MIEPLSHSQSPCRKERFYGGYPWLVLKNLIGWALILLALVIGPIVPGPGGIPLFLLGFALVSFPGKRKLTARVMRGRRIALNERMILIILIVSLFTPALALWLLGAHVGWLSAALIHGLLIFIAAYLLGVVVVGLLAIGAVLVVNLLLRTAPPIRRRVRRWLRRHRVRLLPPRYRRRLSHEPGTGPIRIKGEIIAFLWTRKRLKSDAGRDAKA